MDSFVLFERLPQTLETHIDDGKTPTKNESPTALQKLIVTYIINVKHYFGEEILTGIAKHRTRPIEGLFIKRKARVNKTVDPTFKKFKNEITFRG